MKTLGEINEIAPYHPCEWQQGYGIWQHGYMEGQKSGAAEQKKIDKELIDMLIDELYMSRAYHLGITGLDSAAERAMKEQEGDCALIRGIDRAINYVKKAVEE